VYVSYICTELWICKKELFQTNSDLQSFFLGLNARQQQYGGSHAYTYIHNIIIYIIRVYTYIWICIYTYKQCETVRMSPTFLQSSEYIYIYIHINMYICIYVHTYEYIYTHKHVSNVKQRNMDVSNIFDVLHCYQDPWIRLFLYIYLTSCVCVWTYIHTFTTPQTSIDVYVFIYIIMQICAKYKYFSHSRCFALFYKIHGLVFFDIYIYWCVYVHRYMICVCA
jgi:hypothetical protein